MLAPIRRTSFAPLALFVVFLAAPRLAAETLELRMVVDSPSLQPLATAVETEVGLLFGGEASSLSWSRFVVASGDELPTAVDRSLAGAPDLVIALGTRSVLELDRRRPEIPAIGVDPSGLGIDLETRAVRRITAPVTVGDDLEILQSLVGAASVVALVDAASLAFDPALERRLREAALARGLALELVAVTGADDGAKVIRALEASVEAVYLAPGLTGKPLALGQALTARRLPAFSGRHRPDVEAGVLAGRGGEGRERLARLVALAVLNLARSLPAAETPALPGETGYRVNAETARRLGLDLPWSVRFEADWVGQAPSEGETLSLVEVMRRGVDANLALATRRLRLAADAQQVREALAARRPQAGLRMTGSWIDSASARASFGAQPERRLTATGEASWVLFSEVAAARIDGERLLQMARELELEQARLDLARDAGQGYLAVRRSDALRRVAAQNLRLTRANLAAARAREALGAGGPADVARLEARAAGDRSALVTADAAYRDAALRLNQLLAVPLDQEVVTEPVDAGAADSLSWAFPYAEALGSPARVNELASSIVERTLSRSPGVAAAQRLEEVAGRRLLAARRAFYLPEVSLRGEWTTELAESGAGTEGSVLGLPGDAGTLPIAPDETWSVALGATLPLATGGALTARRERARLEVDATRDSRGLAEQRAEQRARAALIQLEAAHQSSRQAALAARASERAFDVVRDAYRQGGENLTTLLDAQTAFLIARQQEAESAFALHSRWLDVQRETGGFFGLDPEADSFKNQLDRWLEDS